MNNSHTIQHASNKELISITPGLQTSDGDGVNMVRIIGTSQLNMIDPFLLLDAFGSDEPLDYIGGFPSHPHRGFETVTYLLAGKMRHKDNSGNEGVIEAGGVQWMSAGKGIIHSEMPEQENGLLMGFQLWVNLPAEAKMNAPAYQEFSAAQIPLERWENGTEIHVIAGITEQGTRGPVKNTYVNPTYMDITLKAGEAFRQSTHATQNTFVYVIQGELEIGEEKRPISEKNLGILGKGKHFLANAKSEQSRFLLVSAEPLNEPVARGGPFVMNTSEEVKQAFDDFNNNRF